jgi:hypothetical protein
MARWLVPRYQTSSRPPPLVANGTSFVSVIEHQRTRVLAYPVGRCLVGRRWWLRPEARWRRLTAIATTRPILTVSPVFSSGPSRLPPRGAGQDDTASWERCTRGIVLALTRPRRKGWRY